MLLRDIEMKDYIGINSPYLRRWCRSERVPHYFLKKFRRIRGDTNLFSLLLQIRKKLFTMYGKERDYGRSFFDSRFTPLARLLERRMASCGALVVIFGTVLRNFGVPVKFVHGRLLDTHMEDRHAWLKLYDPLHSRWVPIDPTKIDFALPQQAMELQECFDWYDMGIAYKCRHGKENS